MPFIVYILYEDLSPNSLGKGSYFSRFNKKQKATDFSVAFLLIT